MQIPELEEKPEVLVGGIGAIPRNRGSKIVELQNRASKSPELAAPRDQSLLRQPDPCLGCALPPKAATNP
jgi:hypothetical protein